MRGLTRRSVLVALALPGAVFPVSADAPPAAVTYVEPSEIRPRVEAGEVALVDVRTPPEWAKSGVAEGAAQIAMQDPKLGARLLAVLEGDPTRPIALICATGMRSRAVAEAMLRHGFTNVYSVKGGLFGSAESAGWIRSGLPVVPAKP